MSDQGMQGALDVAVVAPESPGQALLQFAREVGELNAVEGVKLEIVSGQQATLDRVACLLRRRADVVIWSGHGRPGRLLCVDGEIDGEWLATQARAGAPRVLVLAACGSGQCDELESLVSEVSRVGINVVGLPVQAEDQSCILFNKEFLRALVAGADVYTAHRVAVRRVAMQDARQADGIVLTPGLTNGYRFIVDRIDAQDARFDRIERELGEIRMLLEDRRR